MYGPSLRVEPQGERLLRDLRKAYLDGRSLYELNWAPGPRLLVACIEFLPNSPKKPSDLI